jgi:large subunit ribosomal protein L25
VAEHILTAQPRAVIGKKVGQLRRQGLVPATIYGPKVKPVNVQFNYRPLQVALMKAGGTNIIDLTVEGGETLRVLARYVQRDVVRGDILHVDFFVLDMKAKIRADIPVHIVGENAHILGKRAILITGTNTVTMEMLPDQLMNFIEVDISLIENIGDAVTVADLKLDEGITVINEPEEMLAKLLQSSAARAESGEDEEGVDSTMPEVIGKGKLDEEGEE